MQLSAIGVEHDAQRHQWPSPRGGGQPGRLHVDRQRATAVERPAPLPHDEPLAGGDWADVHTSSPRVAERRQGSSGRHRLPSRSGHATRLRARCHLAPAADRAPRRIRRSGSGGCRWQPRSAPIGRRDAGPSRCDGRRPRARRCAPRVPRAPAARARRSHPSPPRALSHPNARSMRVQRSSDLGYPVHLRS